MRYYETLYIIDPDLADEDYRDVVTKFKSLIEKNDGVIIKVDEWGKRSLAYEVKRHDKGYYVLLQYCGGAGITDRLKRDLKLDERVLKYQTIKLSDRVDPEALKAEAEQDETKTDAEISPQEEGGSEKDQANEDDIQ